MIHCNGFQNQFKLYYVEVRVWSCVKMVLVMLCLCEYFIKITLHTLSQLVGSVLSRQIGTSEVTSFWFKLETSHMFEAVCRVHFHFTRFLYENKSNIETVGVYFFVSTSHQPVIFSSLKVLTTIEKYTITKRLELEFTNKNMLSFLSLSWK